MPHLLDELEALRQAADCERQLSREEADERHFFNTLEEVLIKLSEMSPNRLDRLLHQIQRRQSILNFNINAAAIWNDIDAPDSMQYTSEYLVNLDWGAILYTIQQLHQRAGAMNLFRDAETSIEAATDALFKHYREDRHG